MVNKNEVPNPYTHGDPRHVINTTSPRHSPFDRSFTHTRKRQSIPFYNDKADYDTNAQSYYDYLARVNAFLDLIEDVVNKMFKRDLTVTDTDSIDLTKLGEWIDDSPCGNMLTGDDIIDISAIVKLSDWVDKFDNAGFEFDLPNANVILSKTEEHSEGVYAPDFTALLKDMTTKITNINNNITNIDKMSVTGTFGTTVTTTGKPTNGDYKAVVKAVKDPKTDNTLEISNHGLYVPPATVLPPAYLNNITALFPWNVANDKTAGVWVNKLLIQGVNVEKRGLREVTCTIWAENPGEGSKQDMIVDLQINNSGGGVATPKLNIPSSWSGILHCDNPRFTN